MRKKWLFVAVAWLVLGAAVFGWLARATSRPAAGVARAADTAGGVNLPIILRPANTPTPSPTSTRSAPTPGPTMTPVASPTPGFGPNWLENGSFEEGWTDLPPVDGSLTNQNPDGWTLSWLERGEEVWDLRTIHPDDPIVGVVSGVAEMIHKCNYQLPPHEQLGGPNALILEGGAVYKMFHRGAAFGSQLTQTVTLPAGSYRLTVPVQLHWHENLDPDDLTWDTFTAESGAWVIFGANRIGGWATARDMGDRRWFYHVVEFNLPATTPVELLIRVKSIYWSPKDFFIDAVWLEPISSRVGATDGYRPTTDAPARPAVAQPAAASGQCEE
jgi:hypothetical protein